MRIMKDIKTDLMDYVNDNYPIGKCDYFEDWAKARGSYIDAFIEYLEVYNKVDYNSLIEKEIIEMYRCLSRVGKDKVLIFISSLHQKECDERILENKLHLGS